MQTPFLLADFLCLYNFLCLLRFMCLLWYNMYDKRCAEVLVMSDIKRVKRWSDSWTIADALGEEKIKAIKKGMMKHEWIRNTGGLLGRAGKKGQA